MGRQGQCPLNTFYSPPETKCKPRFFDNGPDFPPRIMSNRLSAWTNPLPRETHKLRSIVAGVQPAIADAKKIQTKKEVVGEGSPQDAVLHVPRRRGAHLLRDDEDSPECPGRTNEIHILHDIGTAKSIQLVKSCPPAKDPLISIGKLEDGCPNIGPTSNESQNP